MVAEQSRLAWLQQQIIKVDGIDSSLKPALNKHVKMSQHALWFFRGAAQLYYADLFQGNLQLDKQLINAIPTTNIIGDCHISNFGFISEQHCQQRQVIFAPNDFDDACVGSATWDILRFSISLHLAVDYAECTNKVKISIKASESINFFLNAYVNYCADIIEQPELRFSSISQFEKSHVLAKYLHKATQRDMGGSQFSSKSALVKETIWTGKNLTFKQNEERLEFLSEQHYQRVLKQFQRYIDGSIVDIVLRLNAGTGSNNLQRYYLLVKRHHQSAKELTSYQIVEVKQQRQASLLYYDSSKHNDSDPATLSYNMHQRMQNHADCYLRPVMWDNKYWLINSRHHCRLSIKPEKLLKKPQQAQRYLNQYASSCGQALALAHCRGNGLPNKFEQGVVDILPSKYQHIQQRAVEYSDQSHFDVKVLRQLISSC